jgi:agmatine/peptidylarginine deiminase
LNIRIPAEWEEQESILVVFPTTHKDWQHSIKEIQKSYVNFINAIRKYQKCIIICDEPKILDKYFNDFKNIQIVNISTNDTWIRDFGAIDFFEDDKIKSYNFIFNAWGDKFTSNLDNEFNKKFSTTELVDIDFILEGGSIDSNGNGVMLTTSRCIFNKNRNAHLSKEEIINKIKSLFGLNGLIILNHGALVGDDTDSHIDTLARFIDKDTIAYVKCYDKNDKHYEELNLMEDELKKTRYNLVAIPLPKAHYFNDHRIPATYLNFVFINNALILPTYNDEINDKIAYDILSKYFQNKKIICVDASIFIREHGSLHCASMNKYKNVTNLNKK